MRRIKFRLHSLLYEDLFYIPLRVCVLQNATLLDHGGAPCQISSVSGLWYACIRAQRPTPYGKKGDLNLGENPVFPRGRPLSPGPSLLLRPSHHWDWAWERPPVGLNLVASSRLTTELDNRVKRGGIS